MQTLSITLPDELAATIKAKVAAGEYASESEVVRDGLEMLLDEAALEPWMCEEIRASYDEMKADPTLGVPIDDVLGRLLKRVHGSGG